MVQVCSKSRESRTEAIAMECLCVCGEPGTSNDAEKEDGVEQSKECARGGMSDGIMPERRREINDAYPYDKQETIRR